MNKIARLLLPRVLLAAAIALLLVVWTAPAGAEPRFAVREGLRCGHCHVNRTGGGMRTAYGLSFAQTNLSTFRIKDYFSDLAGWRIRFGSNLRLSNRTVLSTKTELEGTERSVETSNSFEMSEGNLYFLADAIPGHLAVYLDETVAPEGASSREAFILLHGLPLDGYVKAGWLMPPFGLRIPDNRAFIRGETGFNYANSDLGVELGIAPHPFALSVAVTNGSLSGTDSNVFKQVSAHAVVATPYLRGGFSFSYNDTSVDDFVFESVTGGAHLAGRLGRLGMLAEMDLIYGMSEPEAYRQWALYTEANFEVVKGLYARFIFEAFDPLMSLDENERDRFVLGASWFPIQLLEVRAQYRINRDIPQRVQANADELIFELHGFL